MEKIQKLMKSEEDEQSTLFDYASYQPEPWNLMFSIPNGGFRSKKTGAKMKRTGLKAGVPDIFLPVMRGKYGGLFIEMKSEKGIVQANQKEWHIKLRAQGYKCEICRGFEQAVKTIEKYLDMP